MKARQSADIINGLETEMAKKINKLIKDQKMKVKAAIMEGKVRVTGNKRDDLQSCIAMIKEAKLDVPLQFNNFRD